MLCAFLATSRTSQDLFINVVKSSKRWNFTIELSPKRTTLYLNIMLSAFLSVTTAEVHFAPCLQTGNFSSFFSHRFVLISFFTFQNRFFIVTRPENGRIDSKTAISWLIWNQSCWNLQCTRDWISCISSKSKQVLIFSVSFYVNNLSELSWTACFHIAIFILRVISATIWYLAHRCIFLLFCDMFQISCINSVSNWGRLGCQYLTNVFDASRWCMESFRIQRQTQLVVSKPGHSLRE